MKKELIKIEPTEAQGHKRSMTKMKCDRRTGGNRRTYSPHLHIPERRSGKDRRKPLIYNKRSDYDMSQFEEVN